MGHFAVRSPIRAHSGTSHVVGVWPDLRDSSARNYGILVGWDRRVRPRFTSQGVAGVEASSVYMHDDPNEGFNRTCQFSIAPQHGWQKRLLLEALFNEPCCFPGRL